MTMKRLLISGAALACCYTALATPAYAYLDGGTASIVLQSLIAGAATVLMFGRHQLARIKGWFSRTLKPSDMKQPSDAE
jgi:hypothetical protein